MSDNAIRIIEKGLSQTRENMVHWLASTPDEKKHILLGASDDSPLEEHKYVIDHSLEKSKDGSFGICEVCNEPVGDELLRMDYTTCVCLGHYSPE